MLDLYIQLEDSGGQLISKTPRYCPRSMLAMVFNKLVNVEQGGRPSGFCPTSGKGIASSGLKYSELKDGAPRFYFIGNATHNFLP